MVRQSPDREVVEEEIAMLGGLDLCSLRDRWHALFGNPAPKSLRRAFLIKACAYQIQVKAFGGLRRQSRSTFAKSRRPAAETPCSLVVKLSFSTGLPCRPEGEYLRRKGRHLPRAAMRQARPVPGFRWWER
jgi:hypothetical protein